MFVDCGAFDGDTIAEFIRQVGESFASIVAFEPDPLNWDKLQRRLELLPNSIRKRIVALPNALGARRQTIAFSATGTDQSKAGMGSVAVDCVTLDEALRDFTNQLLSNLI